MKNPSYFLMTGAVMMTAAFVLPALAETPYTLSNNTTVTKIMGKLDTPTFVKKASTGGMFEVESSKLALEKSSNDQVKQFAQMMIDDHSKANAKLAKIAAKENQQDNLATALDEKHQSKLDALKDSDNFDADYLADMKEGHTKTIAMFKDYAAHGDDAALKTFASKTLPTLKMHKQHLEAINS